MNNPNPAHPASLQSSDNTIQFPKRESKAPGKLERLVVLEGEIRNLPSRAALGIHAVNEPRDLIGFDQAFFVAFTRSGKARMEAASSVAGVEPQAPLVRTICKLASGRFSEQKSGAFDIAVLSRDHSYPHRFGCWVPFTDRKKQVFGGLLLASSEPWLATNMNIADRIGQTYSHALRALSPPGLLRVFSVPRWLAGSVLIGVLGLAFLPVPLTVLAPFEVIAAKPQIVTAPIDGAIASIEALPNASVRRGQVLFRFDATVLQAEAKIATQKESVAAAKLETAQNGAFGNDDYKRSLAVTAKEFELAQVEHSYAEALLARVDVRAERDGMLLYATPADLIGKPLQVGEKVMEIADPRQVFYRIDVGVHDSIALDTGNAVRLFFDADPLHPRRAGVAELSFHASPQADGQLSYHVLATTTDDGEVPRIGLRGTAQISGEIVSLGFYLFRRPIAAIRQALGV
jgi:hypothetical protein